MIFATLVRIWISYVLLANVNLSVIQGMKGNPHLSVVRNWYHLVTIAVLLQPRPTGSADVNMQLQPNGTSSIPPMHGGSLLIS